MFIVKTSYSRTSEACAKINAVQIELCRQLHNAGRSSHGNWKL